MNKLVRREWIAAIVIVLSTVVGCSSSSGIAPVDAGDDATATGAPDGSRLSDAHCDAALTYASFGENFFATYCNRCHAWTQEAAQLSGNAIVDIAGTGTSMPPSSPFPTPDERMQLVNWIGCGAP